MTDTLESLSAELDALPPASQTMYATDAAVERHTAFVRRVAAVVRMEVGNDRIAVGYRLLERAQYIPWNCWNQEGDEPYGA